jgi:O-antigen ligase
MNNSKAIQQAKFLRQINRYLFLLLLLMVACFFTWSENVWITRAIKVVGRLGVLIFSFIVYRKIIRFGAIDTLKWHNTLAIGLYLVYLILGFASFAWSTNVGYSVLQWFMTSQTLVFCYFFIKSLYLLDIYFPKHHIRIFNLLGNVSFSLILLFVVGMWVLPDIFFRLTHGGEEARLGGYFMNPNELGMLAGLGIAGCIFDLFRAQNKWGTILKLLVLFYGLYATGSRSSLIGAFLIIGFHIFQSSNKKLKYISVILMFLIAPIAIQKIIFKDGDQSRMEEVLSMTGRLPFWTALITEGLPREPLLGFGFMRIDYKEYFQSTHTYPGKMTHNTFMQVLMNLGFIGLTIILFHLIFTIYGIYHEPKIKKQILLTLLIPLVINSFTEFGIFGESNYGILFYQLILMYISFKHHAILTPQERIFLYKRRPELEHPILPKINI